MDDPERTAEDETIAALQQLIDRAIMAFTPTVPDACRSPKQEQNQVMDVESARLYFRSIAEQLDPFYNRVTAIGSAAVEPLLKVLNGDRVLKSEQDPDGHRAESYAAQVLGRIGDRRAVEPLIRWAQQPNERHCFAVGSAILAQLGDVRAVPFLVEVLENAETRAERDWDSDRQPARSLREKLSEFLLRGWYRKMREISVPAVRKFYCLRTIDALGQIGDTRAVEPIRKRLNDPDPEVRERATQALERIGT